MTSEHTKAFRVKRAAMELIRAEVKLMEIGPFKEDQLRMLESDIIDFTHAMLHKLHDKYWCPDCQHYCTTECCDHWDKKGERIR